MGGGTPGALRPGGGGGMTSIYKDNPNYLSSERWRWIRSWRLWLDGNRCRACRATDNLHVHHASYRWFGRWYDFGAIMELRDTITLCDRCHGGVHRSQPISEFRD
jgi:hypothetical protein